mmetsp:Transcript_25698/g.67240  ORF Transcript_25698/g.67240 Transcript_25698/m.67240 type:complete len:495 (-) Transcript_25698:157-1641(-)
MRVVSDCGPSIVPQSFGGGLKRPLDARPASQPTSLNPYYGLDREGHRSPRGASPIRTLPSPRGAQWNHTLPSTGILKTDVLSISSGSELHSAPDSFVRRVSPTRDYGTLDTLSARPFPTSNLAPSVLSVPNFPTRSDDLSQRDVSQREVSLRDVKALSRTPPAPSRWPQEVTQHLLPLAAKPAGDFTPMRSSLRMVSGACQIPHPQKAAGGGDDSFFICPDICALGVADGVGAWEKMRIDPRAAAEEMMRGASAYVEVMTKSGSPGEMAMQVMREGYDAVRSFGATTAVVAVLDDRGETLGVSNLGDSGLRQLRKSGGTPWIAGRTTDQQHSFNCPYQLSRLPCNDDIPALLAAGKSELVNAVRRGVAMHQDSPEDAGRYDFRVQEGDLLILGSDGVFDNLHDRELCELAEMTISPFEARQAFIEEPGTLRGPGSSTDAGRFATAIAHAAFHRACDTTALTPFAEHARQHGIPHIGGKLDDITVVCAWVVRTGS